MTQSLAEIVTALAAFTLEDFDYRRPNGGLERLDALCDAVKSLPNPQVAFPHLLSLMERLPEADFGSPGCMVHTMEAFSGAYEDLLFESVVRCPSPLTVWMVNRILNADPMDRDRWMKVLSDAESHPKASEVTRMEARDFLKYQNEG